MKMPLSEDKLRKFLSVAEEILKEEIEDLSNTLDGDGNVYHEDEFIRAVLALNLLLELKEELGYKEPEGTTLKQIQLF